jgi:hypothetical protein
LRIHGSLPEALNQNRTRAARGYWVQTLSPKP